MLVDAVVEFFMFLVGGMEERPKRGSVYWVMAQAEHVPELMCF